jgi:hypothetical protein
VTLHLYDSYRRNRRDYYLSYRNPWNLKDDARVRFLGLEHELETRPNRS